MRSCCLLQLFPSFLLIFLPQVHSTSLAILPFQLCHVSTSFHSSQTHILVKSPFILKAFHIVLVQRLSNTKPSCLHVILSPILTTKLHNSKLCKRQQLYLHETPKKSISSKKSEIENRMLAL
jgi:hypothetical protein